MEAFGLTVCDLPDDVQDTPCWSRAWEAPIALLRRPFDGPDPVCCRLDGLPVAASVLAQRMLSPGEAEFWYSMRAVEKRRHEWLLGRTAAKDAVRLLVEKQFGVALPPAAIEIVPDAFGQPRAEGSWTTRLGIRPAISISHSHGTAVALAASGRGTLAGIDLENLDRRRADFEAIAFSPEERRMLAVIPAEWGEEWALRMWCAKEAVAKAIGRGFSAGIQAFHITRIEAGSGILAVELSEQALDPIPYLRRIPLMAYTGREEDFVFSTTIVRQGAVE